MAVRVKSVGWKLLDVCFSEASGLGISQPLRQAQEGLYMAGGQGQQQPRAKALSPPTSQDKAPRDLIVLHLHIIHIEVQADGGPHCCG